MTVDDALRVLAAMERERVRYVMVGSMAMAANGLVRATRDVDVMVAADEENVARLRTALRSVFDDPSIEEITADDLAGGYPVVQYSRSALIWRPTDAGQEVPEYRRGPLQRGCGGPNRSPADGVLSFGHGAAGRRWRPPSGVHKSRSSADAAALRDAWARPS
jgi:hypothetical protein